MNDEIEIDGIKYMRKQEQEIYDAVPAAPVLTPMIYLFKCGAPDCGMHASDYSYARKSVLVVNNNGHYDELFFTCSEGHRNKLRV